MEKSKNDIAFDQALKTPEFTSFFKNEFAPILREVEAMRKNYLNLYYMIIVAAILIAVGFYFFGKSYEIGFVLGMAVVVTVVVLKYLKIIYALNVKKKVMTKLLSFWGNFTFSTPDMLKMILKWASELLYDYSDLSLYTYTQRQNNGKKVRFYDVDIDKDESESCARYIDENYRRRIEYGKENFKDDPDAVYAASLLLFPNFNRCDVLDIFKGIYKDLNVTIRTVHMKDVNYTKKTTQIGPVKFKGRKLKDLFNGVLVTSTVNKNFNGRVVVRKEKGWMNKLDGFMLPPKVALEDPLFESIFEVYADDQVEARYLLTTAFMERLIAVANNNQFDVICSFENGLLNIGLQKKDKWFDVDLFKPATILSNYKKMLIDLSKILSVIDTLKLEQKIGM